MKRKTIIRITNVKEHMVGAHTQLAAIESQEEADEFVTELVHRSKREVEKVIDNMDTLMRESGR